jgi:hypothetical protein
MKKLLIIICGLIFFHHTASAQNTLSFYQTTTINNVTVILPTYSNLFKLLNAPPSSFLAIMAKYHYTQSKPNDPNTFQANSPDQVYNVDKEPKQVDIFFSDSSSYPSDTKADFLQRYPNARHKSLNDGIEAYYFDLIGKGNYCILFDLPPGGGGGVTLLDVD